jgi:hypothetical protein
MTRKTGERVWEEQGGKQGRKNRKRRPRKTNAAWGKERGKEKPGHGERAAGAERRQVQPLVRRRLSDSKMITFIILSQQDENSRCPII